MCSASCSMLLSISQCYVAQWQAAKSKESLSLFRHYFPSTPQVSGVANMSPMLSDLLSPYAAKQRAHQDKLARQVCRDMAKYYRLRTREANARHTLMCKQS